MPGLPRVPGMPLPHSGTGCCEHAAPAPADLMRAEHLAAAAQRVLEDVELHPGDRTVALDLLAADALITLALLARAEAAPGELAAFASALLRTGRAG